MPQPLPPIESAAMAVRRIRPGSRVWLSSASAVPRVLVEALEARELPDIEYLTYFAGEARLGPSSRHRTFLVSAALSQLEAQGRVDYVPLSLAEAPPLLASGRLKVDAALVQTSPPDARGFVNLGIAVDLTPAVLATGCLAIAEINPNMPRTHGDSFVPACRFAALVESAGPIAEFINPPTGDEAPEIARFIASIIEDGSTLQVGLGRWPSQALKHLADRRDLGIHSDVLSDGIVDLAVSGALSGARKSHDPFRIVGSTAFGTRRLHDFLHENPGVAMRPIEQVAATATIAAQHRMVSVTQAFAIDVTGQACVDRYDDRPYGGVSTQPAFMRGAARSRGGKAILCLGSIGPDGSSSIRAQLRPREAVGIARADMHYVVTEWGIAYLYGRSIRERALALIEIAHPDARDALLREAAELGYLPKGQRLASERAYPVEEERRIALKDGTDVLLRPTHAGDAAALIRLFHQLDEQDRYTRFFRRMRTLSMAEAESLCNVNHETSVAFLAVTGEREAETVIGSGCYFVDRDTNLAEVAYMVAHEYQRRGLGRALQETMTDFARRHGVRGFYAEIMPGNIAMRRLAMTAPGTVTTESEGDTLRVTRVFP